VGGVTKKPPPPAAPAAPSDPAAAPAATPPAPQRRLVEGLDYYMEGGYLVFTAHYLRERGYCCGSGCRHCPYD
jgi:hypothetical protein